MVEMNAFEYLENNCELRSFFRFFQGRADCSGIRWRVKPGDVVAAGQAIGELSFATGGPIEIHAPLDGIVVRTFDPNVADLPFRPSLTIALFLPREATSSSGIHASSAAQ
jgi:Na+-translocating ferredoxin:NAD+ oxidoreductase RnfC subunit